MNEYTEANHRHWDEVVPLHVAAYSYDVPGFKAGKNKLKPVEAMELLVDKLQATKNNKAFLEHFKIS